MFLAVSNQVIYNFRKFEANKMKFILTNSTKNKSLSFLVRAGIYYPIINTGYFFPSK